MADDGQGVLRREHAFVGDDRQRRIEKRGQSAQDSGLRLSAQAKEDEVVTAEQRVDDLRHHRLFVADDAVEDWFARREPGEEVRAKLIFHRAEPLLGGAKGGAL